MNPKIQSVAEACSRGSEDNSLTFPQQLGMLAEVGVEGYWCDLRRAVKVYYLPDGDSVEVAAAPLGVPVAAGFDAARVAAAVRLSQANAHTYKAFCAKVAAAGCAGYLVSILGRRVVYLGRTGESHVELFPSGK